MIFRKIQELAVRYWEIILYGIFGVCTTLVNWVTYTAVVLVLPLTVSNVIAWSVAIVFAFFVNKLFVFGSKSLDLKTMLREGLTFLSARLLSGAIEIGGPGLLVWLGLDGRFFGIEGSVAKAIVSVVVIIMNYVLSKLVIFKKR